MLTSSTRCVEDNQTSDSRAAPANGRSANESRRDPLDGLEATEFLLDKIKGTKNNADFFDSMRRG